MKELEDFLSGLRDDLKKAVDGAPDEKPPEDKKSELTVDERLSKAVAAIATSLDLTIVDGKEDEASPLAKAIAGLQEDNDTYRQVIVKLAERIEKLEGGTASRKQVDEDDAPPPDEKARLEKAKGGTFDAAMKSLLTHGKVTLTG